MKNTMKGKELEMKKPLLFLLCLMLFVSAFVSPGISKAAENRTLTIAVSGDIAGWDPATSIYWLANEVIINTHDTLIDYADTTDAEGRPIRDITKIAPRLAKSWEVSQDGKSFKFNLRKNAKFNNGDPWTLPPLRRASSAF